MVRCTWTLLLAILAIGSQQQLAQAGDQYDLLDFLGDVSFFVPSTKDFISKGLKIWESIKKISPFIKGSQGEPSDSKQIKYIVERVDKINKEVQNTQTMIREQVMNMLPKETRMDSKIDMVLKNVGKVDNLFLDLLLNIDPSRPASNSTLRDMIRTITRVKDGMKQDIEDIYGTMIEVYGNNILDVLSDRKQSATLMCKRLQSSSHMINTLYNKYLSSEMKGIILTLWAYSMAENPSEHKTDIENYAFRIETRIATLMHSIKRFMASAPRDMWKCDKQGAPFAKLSPIFQKYITTAPDTVEKGGRRHMGFWDGFPLNNHCTDLAHAFRHQEKLCLGTLQDCKIDTLYPRGSFCRDKSESDRRYKYIIIDRTTVYGDNRTCKREVEAYKPGACFCTCDDEYNDYANRYFNLRDVTSDIYQNKVVTGIRIRQEGKMIHLQIQQGLLSENGNIKQNTVEWKPIENFNILNRGVQNRKDYFKVTWQNRTINVDNIDAPPNYTLTGVRFAVEDNTVKLEIRYTPFDFISGLLHPEGSKWKSNPSKDDERYEIKFGDELPLNKENIYDLNDKGFLKFGLSSLKTDVGQNVVPFFDLQELSPTPATLLSGVGLIHRGSEESSGFLALKLNTYNYEPHIDLSVTNGFSLDKFADTSLLLQFNKNMKNKIQQISHVDTSNIHLESDD